jgi:type VI protein secretion system component VasK
VTPEFRAFFNRAAGVSDAFYKAGSATPNLTFSLKPVPSDTKVQEITLTINGKTATFRGGRGDAQPFSWPGSGAQEAKLHVAFEGGAEFSLAYSEPWAVFSFFFQADNWRSSGSQPNLEWSSKNVQGTVSRIQGGRPETVAFALDMAGGPPVFQPNFWSTLRCPSPAVK